MRYLYSRGSALLGICACTLNDSLENGYAKACRSMGGFSKIMGITHERSHEKTCN